MGTDSLAHSQGGSVAAVPLAEQVWVVAGRTDVCAELLSDMVSVCLGAAALAALGIRPPNLQRGSLLLP